MTDPLDELLKSMLPELYSKSGKPQNTPEYQPRNDKKDPEQRAKIVKMKKSNIENYLRNVVLARIYYIAKENIEEILGGTLTQLKDHIEKQLPQGWDWDNHGYQWHIDHVIPLKYQLEGGKPTFTEMLSRFKYDNHQPLDPEENMKKGNRHIGRYPAADVTHIDTDEGEHDVPETINPNIEQLNNWGGNLENLKLANSIADARELDDVELKTLHPVENSNENFLAVEKAKFRRFYHFEGEITRDLLLKYSKDRVRAQYIRRRRLRGFDGAEEALTTIGRQFFAAAHKGFDVEHFKQVFDINRDRICLGFLRMFGAKLGELNPRMPKARVVEVLTANYDAIVAECTFTCRTFGVKKSDLPAKGSDNFIKGMLEYINGKLDTQYGLKIRATSKHSTDYNVIDTFTSMFNNDFSIRG